MVEEFAKRRRFVLQRLGEIQGVTCAEPRGAFYVFPSMDAYIGRSLGGTTLDGASALARYLLMEAGVAVVAGEDFGAPRNVRISYATSMDNLREGMDRLARGLRAVAAAA
jgi:aspartate aminotransferase